MLPKALKPHFDAAMKQHMEGRVAAALQVYERLLPSDPTGFDLHHMCGLAYYQLGRMDRALLLLERARRLNPKAASTLMLLGVVLRALGRLPEAESSLREAVRLSPQAYEAWSNLGSLLISANRLEEAIACFRKAVAANPKDTLSWTKLGSACKQIGSFHEALDCQARALKLDPKHPTARRGRSEAFQGLHRPDDAIAELDAHLALYPSDLSAMSMRLMLLNYSSSLSAKDLFEEHLRYGRLAAAQHLGRSSVSLPPREAGAPGKRLRIAFLSADFRRHSVACFIRPLLAKLDPAQFELFLYHDHFLVDAISLEFKALVSQFRLVHEMDNDALETCIRSDAPDILVDLSGHTSIVRLPLFLRRLAPVQLTYLGYPNTTGLVDAIDYRLVDPISDPEGRSEALHTEKLLRFSSCAWCYEAPAEAPAPTPGPAEAGGPLCFGSFNAFFKYSPATLELWKQILDRVPDSRLVLKCVGADLDLWRAKFESVGFASGRVRLLPHCQALEDHLACYSQVDIGLDPTPYNGTTSTCEALWMGVPVLTLRGDRHAARVGASLLQAVGLEDLVADSPDSYVALAVKLASDRERLRTLRSTLRPRMQASLLCDASTQAQRFGDALRKVWNAALTRSLPR